MDFVDAIEIVKDFYKIKDINEAEISGSFENGLIFATNHNVPLMVKAEEVNGWIVKTMDLCGTVKSPLSSPILKERLGLILNKESKVIEMSFINPTDEEIQFRDYIDAFRYIYNLPLSAFYKLNKQQRLELINHIEAACDIVYIEFLLP